MIEIGFRPDLVTAIPNGTDPRFAPGGERTEYPSIVAVARLAPVKRFGLLLDSVATARERVPTLTLTIVGDGPERDALEAQVDALGARRWVEFAGWVAHPDLVEIYRRSWIVASASLGMAADAVAARTDLVLGMQLEPPNLDPTAGAAAAIDEVVYANVFEGLTRFGPDGAVLPGLASEWSTEEGGRRYTFTLREGVRFHDGAAFSAEDVVFTLDRARAEGSTNAQKALFENIEQVEAIDDTTVRITLSEPSGDLPFNLAWGDAVMLDAASVDTLATAPVGTGPFRFDRAGELREEDAERGVRDALGQQREHHQPGNDEQAVVDALDRFDA